MGFNGANFRVLKGSKFVLYPHFWRFWHQHSKLVLRLVGQLDLGSLDSWKYLQIFTSLIGHKYASD